MSNTCLWITVPYPICDRLLDILIKKKIAHSYGSLKDINFDGMTDEDTPVLIIVLLYLPSVRTLDLLGAMWLWYDDKCIEWRRK